MLDLARVADVAIENFVPGVVGRLGCDYATFARVKPDIVYCSISGFGQTGPLRDNPAFHHIINAMSGIMHLESHDDPEPRLSYLQAADVLAGAHAFGAILAALFRRGRTGRGAHLDVSMLEAMIAAEDVTYGAILNGGDLYPGPRAGMVVHRLAGQDFAMQTVGAPQLWPRLLEAMKRPDLADDPRFATPLARRHNWPALLPIIHAWLDGFGTREQAHLDARGAFPEVPHPARGKVRVTATPFHVDGRPSAPTAPAPYRIGEHTHRVLAGLLGYPREKIADLEAAGAIAGVS